MKRIFYIIRLFLNLRKISKDPNDTDAALSVADNLYLLGLLEFEIQYLKQTHTHVEQFKSRYMLPEINLQHLQKLTEGSVGKVYSDHMVKNNLQPDFYKIHAIVNDTTYMMMWMRQTHDFWHAITGFQTSVPHELGLQAFMQAQVNTPLAPLLIGGRIIAATFKNFGEVREILDSVSKGWTMGRDAKCIFPIHWDKHLQTPMSELRKEFGIVPVS